MKIWTKVKFFDDPVTWYSTPTKTGESSLIAGQPIAEITSGSTGFMSGFKLSSVDRSRAEKARDANPFIEVLLADGRRGFVEKEARIIKVKQMVLRQVQTALHESASIDSPVIATLNRGETVLHFGTDPAVKSADGTVWLPVTAPEGRRGFILGDSKVEISKPRIETEPIDGAKNLLIGGIICAVGIGVTAVTYSSASSGGGTYVVAWGAMLFGGIRFVWGLLQMSGAQIR